jgi:hypothetical protein
VVAFSRPYPFVPPAALLTNGLHPFGGDWGGMRVRIITGAGNGPLVPASPARILVTSVFGRPDHTRCARLARRRGPEVWTCDFAGRRFRSYLLQGRDRVMTERFGPLRFRIGLMVQDGRLPRTDSVEAVDSQGRFTFDVAL